MPAVTRSVITLTAGQAAGTDPILTADANRKSLVVGNATATDGRIDVASPGAGEGLPLDARSIIAFGGEGGQVVGAGPVCPTNAIYVADFAATDKITVWTA